MYIKVPGNPIAKNRPRFARRGKYVTTYSDQQTEEGKALAIIMGQVEGRLRGAVSVSFVFQLLDTLPFFELCQRLIDNKIKSPRLKVYIEAGWENKRSNFHRVPEFDKQNGQAYTAEQMQRMAGRMGKNVGENHVVGKLLVEWCKLKEIPFELVIPRKSRGKKLDHEKFCRVTHWNGRTNPEKRDAAMLIWGRQ